MWALLQIYKNFFLDLLLKKFTFISIYKDPDIILLKFIVSLYSISHTHLAMSGL